MNKKLLQLISTGIFGFFIIIAVGSSDDKKALDESTPTEEISITGNDTSEISEPEKKLNWQYSDSKDEMEGTNYYFATTTSTNEVEFEFPYNGGSSLTLTVRNMGKGNELTTTISKGQFMTSYSGDETLKFKFDDEKPFTVSYSSAADGSSDVIFPNSTKKIIAKLKKSKKVMIEASFFNSGRKVFYFDVDGLKWER